MKSIRKWIRNVFGFSGTEINGFLILIPLMIMVVFSGPIYHSWLAGSARTYHEDRMVLDSLIAHWDKPPEEIDIPETLSPPVFFQFDPNKASVSDLRKLGFTEISARRIAAYRAKGGGFTVKRDLLKIYGLDSALYKQLYDFILLPARRAEKIHPERTKNIPETRPFEKKRRIEVFDINTADTTILKTVYGIGSTLAARVVKFRDKLGGFISPAQLYEVYGLDSSAVKNLLDVCYIRPDFTPRKINLNVADEKELAGHPYIRYGMARMLVNYRYQHGDFPDAGDIKKLSALKPGQVERLLPYVSVKD